MKTFIYFSLVVLILSCNREYAVDIPNLKEKIDSFIHAKKCFDKQTKIMIVNLAITNDTLNVEFADSYPNVKKMRFQFDTIIGESRVIFTGEKIKGFSTKKNHLSFPRDIVNIVEANPDLYLADFTSWTYLYKGGKLIYVDRPCAGRK